MTREADWTAPSLATMTALAQDAFARLPDHFRQLAGDVVILVEDYAAQDILDQLEIEDPFELTGLYEGVDLRNRSLLDPLPQMSRVLLYRRPILDEWAERGDVSLSTLIEHVLIHEIGHHMGLSDDDIDAIEAEEG